MMPVLYVDSWDTLLMVNIILIFSCVYSAIGAIAKPSYFVEVWLPFHFYSVNCSGNESTLLNCSYSTTGSCTYNTQDAGVICQS